jgi:deoxyribodipyrimidine photo-lyase
MVRDVLPTMSSLPSFPASARSFLNSHEDPAFPELIADLKGKYDPRSTIPYRGGEKSALRRLEDYVAGPLWTYKHTRNALHGLDSSTHFSPFLAVGALSARQIFWSIRRAEESREGGGNQDSYWVVFELLWRDYWKFLARGPMADDRLFALYGMKSDGEKKHDPQGNEWSQDMSMFEEWKEGRTGIPFVDANMRELAATGTYLCSYRSVCVVWPRELMGFLGYMSNRGRQNVGSFLAGQMNLDWRIGAEWFESCLVDHDVCSNYGNWTYGW